MAPPKGYVSLLEAVIRLAEARAPEAGVRKYLETGGEALWQAIMASWPADVPFDWLDRANIIATPPPTPGWGALAAARDELRQTLGDGDLIGVQRSFSTGRLATIKPEPWRVREGFEAFQSERLDGGRVLLGEVDFAQWMAGDAPTVAAEADETTQASAAESQYPAIGEIPKHRHLTACEVLTWIGYGRAISKEVYFPPFDRASGIRAEERNSLLHRSVPDPKPPDDPMDDAERKLMEAVRAGHVHMLTERNGAFEEMPTAIYEHAVVVTARGSIEADWKAPERDRERAITYRSSLAPIGDVWFRKSEVLEAWPNPAAPTGAPTSLSDDENVAGDVSAKPQPTDRAVREWFKNRVDAWPDDRSAPSEDDDWLAITQHFAPGLTRDEFRIVRNDKDVTPPEWRTQGRRLLWGKVKARKSAEKPR
jgi:hypothetical protein